MINRAARIVIRPDDDAGTPGLIIGTCFKNQELLKSDRVYEIREVLGGLMIVDVGRSLFAGGRPNETVSDSPIRQHWCTDIGYLIRCVGNQMVLSREEYARRSN